MNNSKMMHGKSHDRGVVALSGFRNGTVSTTRSFIVFLLYLYVGRSSNQHSDSKSRPLRTFWFPPHHSPAHSFRPHVNYKVVLTRPVRDASTSRNVSSLSSFLTTDFLSVPFSFHYFGTPGVVKSLTDDTTPSDSRTF